MKYLMFILMVFCFPFSVHALQFEDETPTADYSDTVGMLDFALPSELDKVPIGKQSPLFSNVEFIGTFANENPGRNNGNSLPYEVGWRSSLNHMTK